MAAKVVADHVIVTDPAIAVDTDLDLDPEVVITVTDLLRHTEDDHHLHTNAKEDLALESEMTFKAIKLGIIDSVFFFVILFTATMNK